ncbi:MAG: ABC transporter permease [Bacteroides sp.]|nr:ABC transporter permease [Bacillota bacterium]MCM1394119.1 ABC transporter permease [[Eubacterium] siraeum]MCM1455928.1 ABC transporter permease [Bacteroides sp.]
MKMLFNMTARNMKVFFKDKGLFFVSMITPAILLILYSTFLAGVYRDNMPEGLPSKLVDGLVSGQVVSSMLAVICVTVSFCSNMVMVQDKISGANKDFAITPVKKPMLALSYFLGTLLVTMLICIAAMVFCFIYMGATAWYMTAGDVFLLILDVFLLTLFGTALSSVINCFINTQGQSSAVGTIVSAGYGFFCGAYMPIASLGDGMQKFVSLLPGTYGTSLVRNHAMGSAIEAVKDLGAPNEVVEGIKNSVDCNLNFFGAQVSEAATYLVLVLSTAVLIGAYVLINFLMSKRKKK